MFADRSATTGIGSTNFLNVALPPLVDGSALERSNVHDLGGHAGHAEHVGHTLALYTVIKYVAGMATPRTIIHTTITIAAVLILLMMRDKSSDIYGNGLVL